MISVVIPIHNEADSLETLHAELDRVVAASALGAAEFVFVDDGSRDRSWEVVRQLAAADPASGRFGSAATSARPPP